MGTDSLRIEKIFLGACILDLVSDPSKRKSMQP